jgi:hypothetical protein
MTRTSNLKVQQQSKLLHLAETFLYASIALEDDDNDDNQLLGLEDQDQDVLEEDNVPELLELQACVWAEIALAMTGDGS